MVVVDRREHTRNGDGRANGCGKRATAKDDGIELGEVGGHAAKRNGHLVEINCVAVVRGKLFPQKVVECAVRQQRVASDATALESKLDCLWHFAPILTAPVANVGIWRFENKDGLEEVTGSNGAEFLNAMS